MLALLPTSARRAAPTVVLCAFVMMVVMASAAPVEAEPEHESAASHVAGLLADRPVDEAVVVSDLLAGDYDVSATEEILRSEFGRLDVPFFVFASPYMPAELDGDDLLAAVQDRVGRDGIYVHMSNGHSLVRTGTVGVELPTRDATTVLLRDETFDHESRLPEVAEGYVDALLDPDVAQRAESLRESGADPASEGLGAAWRGFLDDVDPTTSNGPANTGFLASLLAGAALGLAGTMILVHRRRANPNGRRSKGRNRRTAHRGENVLADLPTRMRVVVLGCVAAALVVIAAGATHVWLSPETAGERRAAQDALSAPPYVGSTLRVDRIAQEWRQDPLYVDPLAGGSRQGIDELSRAVDEAPVPVWFAAVPMDGADESEGDTEVLAHALAHTVDEPGVYVVAEPGEDRPGVALVEVGGEVDARDLHRTRRENDTALGALRPVLDQLDEARVESTAERTVPTAAETGQAPTSRMEHYFGGGFLPGLLLLGPIAGALLYGMGVGLRALSRRVGATPGRRLRPLAHRETTRMVAAIDAASAGGADVHQAVREADTALMVLGDTPDELDLVGVIVLARRARRRLGPGADRADTVVCMVNPLHGLSVGSASTTLARKDMLPMCRKCLAKDDRDRRPLRVTAGRGRKSHLLLDRTWVLTQYGGRKELTGEHLLEETGAH